VVVFLRGERVDGLFLRGVDRRLVVFLLLLRDWVPPRVVGFLREEDEVVDFFRVIAQMFLWIHYSMVMACWQGGI